MIKEHDRVILTSDLPADGLKAGDVGTVIHIHGKDEAFEVEFLTLHGETAAIATLSASQTRPVTQQDMTHARFLNNRPSENAFFNHVPISGNRPAGVNLRSHPPVLQ